MLDDVFAILSSTPDILRRELAGMSLREMKTRPAASKWSAQEVLAHLNDVEEIAMQSRVQAMLEQETPVLAAFNQEARVVEMRYDRQDPRHSLQEFTRRRRANVRWLRRIKPAQLKRKGLHEQVGEITVGEFLNEWAFHDLGHLKQVLEIRRHALYPRMGNMKAFYQPV